MGIWSLSWEDPPEEDMAAHSSTLAWEIPWTEEPGGLQSIGLHNLVIEHMHSGKQIIQNNHPFSRPLPCWHLQNPHIQIR